ncbi:MAG TPA: hypothetical protein VMU51_38055 [Mycobacteriales bacterium]|nr:hypothetical protein [Mycobacteriales bacterium]
MRVRARQRRRFELRQLLVLGLLAGVSLVPYGLVHVASTAGLGRVWAWSQVLFGVAGLALAGCSAFRLRRMYRADRDGQPD